ncbi:hypothetical protein OSB04_009193 [Centaurea solstitialis]|uniref:TIR domain-containing protein n=1 Tax=Centaurea solstitialis TaxID=347529 RepID=A0AA38TVQ2_9ASTR|nr:hypothetical protein OSB04_009193 [Centaurea solstitialis]
MASSSSSSVEKRFKHDVYLSFRGEDTRKAFTDHLHSALEQQGIRTYKDDETLITGESSIKSSLFKAIEESNFSIIVFSKNYASSSWCLDELVKIMECHNTTNQIVFPVFYHVEPYEVRRQTGAFGEAFAIHNNKIEAAKWREALLQAANLPGWVLQKTAADGHPAKVIKEIVGHISSKLPIRPTNEEIYLNQVGMEARVKEFLSSLETDFGDDALMIGITGMGGIGKTTLARTIYQQISYQFDGSSFVYNVREVSKSSGLCLLQKTILSDVLHQSIIVTSVWEGTAMIKRRLRDKKVLIVLDDVDHLDQLKALAGRPDWFKAGSRILISARDKHLLAAHGVQRIHTVGLLSHEEAICLFSRLVFQTDAPVQAYKNLSLVAVHQAAGLPLAIKVLGSYLHGKSEHEWMSALKRLGTYILNEIGETLEESFIQLDYGFKEIFLDVACLLKGLLKDDVVRILESCGYYARVGLIDLEEKSLITINDSQCVVLHPLLEEMGKDIVRRMHLNDPNRHSRLWILDEIERVLAENLGTEATEAIGVDSPVKPSSEVVTIGFGSMKNLRLLRVVSEIDDDCDEKIGQTIPNFPNALCFLSWVGYPCWSLPKTFEANNLVALEMPYSRIIQLWEGGERKILNKLRFLNLRHTQLRYLDLALTPNLERLELEDCNRLVELVTPDGCLRRLVFLNLSGCSRIKSFRFIKQLESLEVLCLSRLYLKKFPDIIPGNYYSRLLELQFGYNNVKEVPSSIANLQKLVRLDFHSCRKLKSLPDSICALQHLRNLKLRGCILEDLPQDIGRLGCLEKLNLAHTNIKHLPGSICMLKDLKSLNLSSCWNLEKLPGDVGRLECLQELVLTECTQLRDIPESICKLKSLKHLSLSGCIHLEKLPKELELLVSLEVLNIKGICIRHLPRSMSFLTRLNSHVPKRVQVCGFDP